MAKRMVSVSAVELRKMKAKIEAEARKKAKKDARKTDGLSPFLIGRYRSALREVWQRCSEARKICVRRCALPDGYSKCEACKKKVPKVYIDHIVACGDLDDGYIARLSVPSSGLQGLCKKCHDEKTKQERASKKKTTKPKKVIKSNTDDFF